MLQVQNKSTLRYMRILITYTFSVSEGIERRASPILRDVLSVFARSAPSDLVSYACTFILKCGEECPRKNGSIGGDHADGINCPMMKLFSRESYISFHTPYEFRYRTSADHPWLRVYEGDLDTDYFKEFIDLVESNGKSRATDMQRDRSRVYTFRQYLTIYHPFFDFIPMIPFLLQNVIRTSLQVINDTDWRNLDGEKKYITDLWKRYLPQKSEIFNPDREGIAIDLDTIEYSSRPFAISGFGGRRTPWRSIFALTMDDVVSIPFADSKMFFALSSALNGCEAGDEEGLDTDEHEHSVIRMQMEGYLPIPSEIYRALNTGKADLRNVIITMFIERLKHLGYWDALKEVHEKNGYNIEDVIHFHDHHVGGKRTMNDSCDVDIINKYWKITITLPECPFNKTLADLIHVIGLHTGKGECEPIIRRQ